MSRSAAWKPGEPTAKLLRESAANRGEDWSRLAAATAKDLGRRSVGIEIEERWCEIAALRMGQEVLDVAV